MKKQQSSNNETDFISSILFKYLPYWPLFLLLLVFGVAAATVYLLYTPPTYQATAAILLKDEKKGVEESTVMENLNMMDAKNIVENETEVIHSRKFMHSVVNQLHLYAPVYEKTLIKAAPAYYSSPITIRAKDP